MRGFIEGEDQPFQFRDLRAKSASDDTPEAATARLGHTNAAITESVYRRKPATVRPLASGKKIFAKTRFICQVPRRQRVTH